MRLREAGLTRLHLGMETASDALLRYMRKGVTKEQHVIAGQRVKQSGIELSEYVMPGLGGKKWWQEHALETADALNSIDPDFIRFRTLKVTREMILYQKLAGGDFLLEEDEETLVELRLLISRFEGITSFVKSDHIMNLLEEVEGRLPEDKEAMLRKIDRYFELSPEQRLVYRMGRRAGLLQERRRPRRQGRPWPHKRGYPPNGGERARVGREVPFSPSRTVHIAPASSI